MTDSPINIISKIGNYALPAFSAFITAAFAIGNFSWPDGRDRYFLLALSLYTIISVFIAYTHRLFWLRHRNKLKNKGKTLEDLPLFTLCIFLFLHALLIIALVYIIYNYSWL